jgi:hypothetical protein
MVHMELSAYLEVVFIKETILDYSSISEAKQRPSLYIRSIWKTLSENNNKGASLGNGDMKHEGVSTTD